MARRKVYKKPKIFLLNYKGKEPTVVVRFSWGQKKSFKLKDLPNYWNF